MASVCLSNLLFGILVITLFLWPCDGQGETARGQRRRQRNRNTSRRSNAGGLDPSLQLAYVNAYVEGTTTPTQTQPAGPEGESGDPAVSTMTSRSVPSVNPWVQYTPSLPAANEVECYVEVLSIREQGGRCTQLGGMSRPFICQSGANFEFDPSCEQVVLNRQAAALSQSQSQESQGTHEPENR